MALFLKILLMSGLIRRELILISPACDLSLSCHGISGKTSTYTCGKIRAQRRAVSWYYYESSINFKDVLKQTERLKHILRSADAQDNK